jgi:hypothetical protein
MGFGIPVPGCKIMIVAAVFIARGTAMRQCAAAPFQVLSASGHF